MVQTSQQLQDTALQIEQFVVMFYHWGLLHVTRHPATLPTAVSHTLQIHVTLYFTTLHTCHELMCTCCRYTNVIYPQRATAKFN